MTKRDAESLADALRRKFSAEVEVQAVNGNGRYRFAIVSQDLQRMNQLERQDAIWEVVDATLPRNATIDVSLILAFSPAELAEAPEAD